jgi:hypothetical protein
MCPPRTATTFLFFSQFFLRRDEKRRQEREIGIQAQPKEKRADTRERVGGEGMVSLVPAVPSQAKALSSSSAQVSLQPHSIRCAKDRTLGVTSGDALVWVSHSPVSVWSSDSEAVEGLVGVFLDLGRILLDFCGTRRPSYAWSSPFRLPSELRLIWSVFLPAKEEVKVVFVAGCCIFQYIVLCCTLSGVLGASRSIRVYVQRRCCLYLPQIIEWCKTSPLLNCHLPLPASVQANSVQ